MSVRCEVDREGAVGAISAEYGAEVDVELTEDDEESELVIFFDNSSEFKIKV